MDCVRFPVGQLRSHLNLLWEFKYALKVMSAYKKTSRESERFNFFKMVPNGRFELPTKGL